MNLDLTGLAEIVQPGAGEPLMLPLESIGCDSKQPRKHFDEAALQELAESIRSNGVVQPISVHPDPESAGRYIINYGERRYRASIIADMQTIPAFLHNTPDNYTQVAENLHRADLSPMEMALFIRRRLDAGEKKNEIAAKLGYKNYYVTEHLALLEAPPCVEKAYANGATSARTLYDLRRLHDDFPHEVEAWCASGVAITRDSVAALVQKFSRDEISVSSPVQEFSRDEILDGAAESQASLPTSDTDDAQAPSPTEDDAVAAPSTKTDSPSGAHRRGKQVSGPLTGSQSSPRLHIKVEHGGRKATLLEDCIVHIRYDDGAIAEVRLADMIVLGTTAA
jgi:ParB family chromosome partitioning protein